MSRPAILPSGSWPRSMPPELATAYCDERTPEAFLSRVGKDYPPSRVNEGRRQLWLRDDLDAGIFHANWCERRTWRRTSDDGSPPAPLRQATGARRWGAATPLRDSSGNCHTQLSQAIQFRPRLLIRTNQARAASAPLRLNSKLLVSQTDIERAIRTSRAAHR